MRVDKLVVEGPAMLGRARRFVAQQLEGLGLVAVSTDAQLVAGELVTNVFLHVGGPATLVVVPTPSGVRLEVQDASPVPPVRTSPGGDAMTGRGLRLIDGIASRWGVTQLGTGKAVWAELHEAAYPVTSPTARLDEDALLALWPGEEQHTGTLWTSGTIDLGRVPTQLLVDAKAHVDNLVREFTLIASGSASGASGGVPAAVTRLIEAVVHGFTQPRQMLKRAASTAAAAGQEQVSVILPLPTDVAAGIAAAESYLDALDQANAFCRAARMLTLESPPQHRVFHRWYVNEYIAHLRNLGHGTPHRPQRFEERLLQELGVITTAHRLADRAARLHSLAVALSAALTPEAVAEAVLNEGVTAMGASGGVVLLPRGSASLSVPGAIGHDEHVMARLRHEHPDAALPAAEALRSGEAVWLETPAQRNEQFPELIGFEPATVAMCAVPMMLGDRRLGALRFSFREARLFDDEERAFVTAMAAQTAQALHRAELYHHHLDVVQRLQSSLLPSRLPDIPGIDVAAAYHPLTDAMDVGGDFYDVWRCAEDHWAFAIGDVCGSGPEAASVTGLVRHTLRALTATPLSIEEIILRLNEALLEAVDDVTNERFCTVTLGFLNLEDGGAAVDLASGGHPHPLVVAADGRTAAVELRGTILGVLDDVAVDRRRIDLEPGESLVLVTDGATEARNGGAMLGIEGVADAVSGPSTGASDLVRRIERTVCQHGGGRLRDDLALLVVRRI
ncbi:MAG TPA: SpoIIE family protein phosphatase [Euzebya sp.]|nr:SpoIIE family protein phosphatase [Euzebya sp.]